MNRLIQQYKSLDNVPVERICSEFCKIISSDSFRVQLFQYRDIFVSFIPELKDMIDFPQNNPYHAYDVFGHTIHAMEACDSKDVVVRLTVFFHDFGKPHSYQDGENGIRHFKGHGRVSADITDSIMKRLNFDDKIRKQVVELVYYHDATFKAGNKYVRRWLNKIGEKQFRRLLEVRKADIKGQRPDYEQERIEQINRIENILEEVLQEEEKFSFKDLAVNGKDLINIGYKAGRELGVILQKLFCCVMAEEVSNNKEDLLELAKKWLLHDGEDM